MAQFTEQEMADYNAEQLANPPSFTRAELVELLKSDKPRFIEFTKVSGEKSGMLCTLNPEFLPPLVESEEKTSVAPRAVNESIIHVYSLDRKAWRSFRVANLFFISPPLDV